MKLLTSTLLLGCLSIAPGCGDSDDPPAETSAPDTHDATDTADGDTLEDAEVSPRCCPIAAQPTCDCFAVGGGDLDRCYSICDAIPVGWTITTDEHGCPMWTGGTPGSCLDIDADASDSDASDTGDTSAPPDATDTVDAPDSSDTDAVTPPVDDVSLRFRLAGAVRIIEMYSGGAGEVAGSWIEIDLRDRAAPMTYELAAEDGACKVWRPAQVMCTPPCDADEMCDVTSTCEAQATFASAGELTLSGLVTTFSARGGIGGYVLSPEPPHDGLFAPGDAITVAAAGGDIPAFTAEVRGVADLAIQGTGLVELHDDKDATFEWTPVGDGSLVEVVLQLGWHGAPPTGIIACRAPDGAGAITLTPVIIRAFPYFGGIGLFQVPSWIERVSRTVVDAPGGPIEITASSRVNLGVIHEE